MEISLVVNITDRSLILMESVGITGVERLVRRMSSLCLNFVCWVINPKFPTPVWHNSDQGEDEEDIRCLSKGYEVICDRLWGEKQDGYWRNGLSIQWGIAQYRLPLRSVDVYWLALLCNRKAETFDSWHVVLGCEGITLPSALTKSVALLAFNFAARINLHVLYYWARTTLVAPKRVASE